MGDAFTGRAVLHRERENLKKEVIQVDIKGIMDGTAPDVPLQRNDVLYIPSIHDLEDVGSVMVYGEVAVRVSSLCRQYDFGGYYNPGWRIDGVGFYRPCGCFPPYQG